MSVAAVHLEVEPEFRIFHERFAEPSCVLARHRTVAAERRTELLQRRRALEHGHAEHGTAPLAELCRHHNPAAERERPVQEDSPLVGSDGTYI